MVSKRTADVDDLIRRYRLPIHDNSTLYSTLSSLYKRYEDKLLDPPVPDTKLAAAWKAPSKVRGVNLGGWLVVEKWISPKLFTFHPKTENLIECDEFTLCETLGKEGTKKLLGSFRDFFITEEDFVKMKDYGVNAVRIPFGWWLFGESPYLETVSYLDKACVWGLKYGISILFDFQAAPGSQNTWAHSGKKSEIPRWDKSEGNVTVSEAIILLVVERYKKFPNIFGIEVMNEPRWDLNFDILSEYYKTCYKLVKAIAPKWRVVVPDYPNEETGKRFVPKDPIIKKLTFDVHAYYVFGPFHESQTFEEKLYCIEDDGCIMNTRVKEEKQDVIVGEFALAYSGVAEINDDEMREYAVFQLEMVEKANAWFFYNYKHTDKDEWSLEKCIEKGWLPPKLNLVESFIKKYKKRTFLPPPLKTIPFKPWNKF